jgi:hypothetical protein
MKKLSNVLLVVFAMGLSGYVAASGFPYNGTNFTVGCSMTNNDSGEVNYEFAHGAMNYRQSGIMMVVFQSGMLEYYSEIIGSVPDKFKSNMDWVGELEKSLK